MKIFAPVEGDIVVGGSTLLTRGTAAPGTEAAAVDLVQLDLGDGLGFREVIGLDNWQLNWNVPTFTTDTEVIIRARAYAEDLEVTDSVTVTVTQLAVNIIDPLDGASVLGGEPLAINGDASGILGGAALDSVVVDIGAEHLVASGTTAWDTTWLAPSVGADTPVDIIATAWAGGESVSSTISVTVVP